MNSGSGRMIYAFFVAPLVVPLLMILALRPPIGDPGATLLIGGAAMIAYIFTFLLGIPICWFLYVRRLTAFWIAPVAGAMVALVVWYGFAASFSISLAPLSWLPSRLSEPEVTQIAMFFALAGAAVGAIWWLIARPDRIERETAADGKVGSE